MDQKLDLLSENPKWTMKRQSVARKAALISCCCVLLLVLLVFIIFAVLIYSFPQYSQYLVFQHFRRVPNANYKNLTADGVTSIGRNFYLKGEQGKIGVWHMLPMGLTEKYREMGIEPTDEEIEAEIAKDNDPIVIYAHGISWDRTVDHRRMLYNVLTDMDYHVIAFDYRGYGDSDGSPSELGVTADAKVVYEYVRSVAGNNVVIIWGHSMGTGISTRLVRDLSLEGNAPDGLVLESAFNNLQDLLYNHPLASLFGLLPEWIIDKLVIDRLKSVGFTMESDKRIRVITCPILIAHAADDHIIPADLSRKLVKVAKRASRDVKYVEFDATRNFRHKFIYLAEELPGLVRRFIHKCTTKKGLKGG